MEKREIVSRTFNFDPRMVQEFSRYITIGGIVLLTFLILWAKFTKIKPILVKKQFGPNLTQHQI